MAPRENDEKAAKKEKLKQSQRRIRKPTRSEPSNIISEFNLVKSSVSDKNLVTAEDLVKALGSKTNVHDLKKKIKAIKTTTKVLPKPLEKPAADRVKRKVGFENAKKTLNKWAGVIAHQRTAVSVKFPLKENSMQMEPSEIANRFVLKTDLEKKLEEIDPPKQPEPVTQDKFSLTLAEILEQRSEAAKLRAQQSYLASKARRTKKIKSKKYHRIARKAKTKQQIKEFEELKKKNPEAALEKLDLIDKARAHERMTLRHKSTGQWAKNKQIRAKYDSESRKVLAEQLAISRELTQKLKTDDSDEDDYVYENAQEDAPTKTSETDNPWNANSKPSESEVDAFIGQYRKYWDEQHKKLAEGAKDNEEQDSEDSEKESVDCVDVTKEFIETDNVEQESADTNDVEKKTLETNDLAECVTDASSTKKGKKKKTKKQKEEIESKKSPKKLVKSVEETTKSSNSNKKKSLSKTDSTANESVQNKKSKTEKIQEKKMKNKKNKKKDGNSEAKSKDNSVEDLEKLGLKNQRVLRPQIDKPMDESDDEKERDVDAIKTVINQVTTKRKIENTTLDQNKIIKPKIMKTMLPDDTDEEDVLDDIEDENEYVSNREDERRFTQAFRDTDLARDFRKEKAAEIKKNQPQDIDLTLPGWGSWGGPGIKVSRRKRRRFIFKAPKAAPRRDENKGDVVILEENAPKIRRHMVNDLPFPYNAVKDFEASIRAPIGREFVPEKTFTKLTLPHVKTKMGKIIEPMTEDALVKQVKCDLDAREKKPLAGAVEKKNAKNNTNKGGKKK
ncbi:U3 small nucleolar RNA-associated protein 14 homolog A [Trichogramma pretiosum]|uniref:U3 small nucleolar RNA-associated protein 14 homolog A n=1 Tax=Trichogramma pretiosum TaxID=7493 RepID=UPI0006C9E2A8|nr:U3 small nucleolar RNA-associated protein 14 homolog A [Trichogramma pretiosum]